MMSIYHTTNTIPFLSLINSIILVLGVFFTGKLLIKFFKLELIFKNISEPKYQYILIGSNFLK